MFATNDMPESSDYPGAWSFLYPIACTVIYRPTPEARARHFATYIRRLKMKNDTALKRARRERDKKVGELKRLVSGKWSRMEICATADAVSQKEIGVSLCIEVECRLDAAAQQLEQMKIMKDEQAINRYLTSCMTGLNKHYERQGGESSILRAEMDRERFEAIHETVRENWKRKDEDRAEDQNDYERVLKIVGDYRLETSPEVMAALTQSNSSVQKGKDRDVRWHNRQKEKVGAAVSEEGHQKTTGGASSIQRAFVNDPSRMSDAEMYALAREMNIGSSSSNFKNK